MNNNEITCQRRKTSIGGQALMEGIMMRGPKKSTMAVRRPNGEMVLEDADIKPMFKGPIVKIPIIRGMFNFIDSMRIGYSCLMRSADISALEEIRNESAPDTDGMSEEEAKAAKEKQKKKDNLLMGGLMVIASVLAVALCLGLFFYLPSLLYNLTLGRIEALKSNAFVKSLFEGVLKIALFIGYMALVSLMNDIKRTFMYHGAEHKTIFCYESGLPLTVENVRKQSRFHPRCGTSFLILMLIVGVFIGMLIPTWFNPLLRTVVRLLLLPITMGIGYELIKIAGKHDNVFIRIISAPGLWLQRISTREPTDDMIECAIAAIESVIPDDGSDIIK